MKVKDIQDGDLVVFHGPDSALYFCEIGNMTEDGTTRTIKGQRINAGDGRGFSEELDSEMPVYSIYRKL